MKIRERLKKIRESKSREERLRLAMDVMETMDTKILKDAEYVRSLVDRQSQIASRLTSNAIAYDEISKLGTVEGKQIANAVNCDFTYLAKLDADIERQKQCSFDLMHELQRGNSQFFRDLADAIEKRKKHKPHPDKIRAAIIEFCNPPSAVFSVRDILACLSSKEINLTEDSPRIVRRICKELGFKTSHTPGRPKKSGHESV
jgi:hypothetical protein